MNKKFFNSLPRLLLTLILALALSISIVGCGAKSEDEDADSEEETEEVTVVYDGDFTDYTTVDGSNILTADVWTGAEVVSHTTDEDGNVPYTYTKAGIIDTTTYTDDDITSSVGKIGEDNYVLMIHNIAHTEEDADKGSVYEYTSSQSYNLEAGKYYKLTAWVKTIDVGDSGAYIYLSTSSGSVDYISSALSNGGAINTNGEWQKVEFFIRNFVISTKNMYVQLGLGQGTSLDGNIATGYVFFDSVNFTESTKADYDSADIDNKVDFVVTNGNFQATTSTDTYMTTANWSTTYVGSFANVKKGVIDVNDALYGDGTDPDKKTFVEKYGFANPGVASDISSTSNDTKILAIYSGESSDLAYAYYNKDTVVRLTENSYYKVTFYANTLNLDSAPNKANLYVKIDSDTVLTINTHSTWEKFTLYVSSDTMEYNDMKIYFYFGDAKSSTDTENRSKGAAFIDNVSLDYITQADYDSAVASDNVGVYSYIYPNHVTNVDAITVANWTKNMENCGYTDINTVMSATSYSYDQMTANSMPTIDNHQVGEIAFSLDQLAAGDWTYTIPATIYKNNCYRFMFYARLSDMSNEDSTATLSILNSDDEVVSTLSTFNSTEWQLISFYIKGNELTNNSIKLKVSLGSGDMYNPTSLVTGKIHLSCFYLRNITNATYTNASAGTYVGTYSFANGVSSDKTTKLTNDDFSQIDIDASFAYDTSTATKDIKATSKLDYSGNILAPLVPTTWTVCSNEDYVDGNSISGIVNSAYWTSKTISSSNPFSNAIANGNSVLLINNTVATAYGYATKDITLSANSYYELQFSVWADNIPAESYAYFIIKGEAETRTYKITNTLSNVNANNGWVTYYAYIETGLTDTTIDIYMWLGYEDAETTGVVVFDNIFLTDLTSDINTDATMSLSYSKSIKDYAEVLNTTDVTATTISKWADLDNTNLKLSFKTDGFEKDYGTEDAPYTPANFTGSIDGSAPDTSSYYVAGVYKKGTAISTLDLESDEIEQIENNFLDTLTSDSCLIIYNKQATAYKYTGTSYTLATDNYYEISVKVKTILANNSTNNNADNGAVVYIDIDGTPYYMDDVLSNDNWTTYTFYIKMANVEKDVTLVLGLGQYELDESDTTKADESKYTMGWAGFDDIYVSTITETYYNDKTASLPTTAKNVVLAEEEVEDEDDDDDETTSTTKTDIDWATVITVVIECMLGIAVLAVLIVFAIRKISPKIQKRIAKATRNITKSNKSTYSNQDKDTKSYDDKYND